MFSCSWESQHFSTFWGWMANPFTIPWAFLGFQNFKIVCISVITKYLTCVLLHHSPGKIWCAWIRCRLTSALLSNQTGSRDFMLIFQWLQEARWCIIQVHFNLALGRLKNGFTIPFITLGFLRKKSLNWGSHAVELLLVIVQLS